MKKIGHTGTLDPMATGVVNVMAGGATRLIPYLQNPRKRYRATMQLGLTSDTLDIWGQVRVTDSEASASKEEILKVFEDFTGEIVQIPPMYSAVKVKGKKLYELARKGETVERKERIAFIERIDWIEQVEHSIIFDVVCSRGTYVRTLIDDMGKAMGTTAVMTDLIRLENEGVSIDEALTLEEIQEYIDRGDRSFVVAPLDIMRDTEERVQLDEKAYQDLKNGRPVTLNVKSELALISYKGRLVGLAGREQGQTKVIKRFISEG